MDRRRRMSHLATALAVLAIGLRILLPALHSHPPHAGGTHAGGHGSLDSPAAVACSCGHVHAVATAAPDDSRDDSREGAEPAPAACDGCLACELEQGTPVDLPAATAWQGTEPARHGPPSRAGESRDDRYPYALARPRAPPRLQA